MRQKLNYWPDQWLKSMPSEVLSYLAKLSQDKDYPYFVKFVLGEAERRKNIIWNAAEYNKTNGDTVGPAIEKGVMRGGVEFAYDLIALMRASSDEVERRVEGVKKQKARAVKYGQPV